MAYRNDKVRPTAKVVIQAESQIQLDQILLALQRAVASYQQPVKDWSTSSRGR